MTVTSNNAVPIKFHPAVAELAPEWAIRKIEQFCSENAALRAALIDATGQRDEYYRQLISRTAALQQELDKLLQERPQ